MSERTADLREAIDRSDDPLIDCYPAKLSQVLMNVLVNACHAIHSRQLDEPALVGQIEIMIMIKGKNLQISINDNGCGMSEASQQKIFEPFYTPKVSVMAPDWAWR